MGRKNKKFQKVKRPKSNRDESPVSRFASRAQAEEARVPPLPELPFEPAPPDADQLSDYDERYMRLLQRKLDRRVPGLIKLRLSRDNPWLAHGARSVANVPESMVDRIMKNLAANMDSVPPVSDMPSTSSDLNTAPATNAQPTDSGTHSPVTTGNSRDQIANAESASGDSSSAGCSTTSTDLESDPSHDAPLTTKFFFPTSEQGKGACGPRQQSSDTASASANESNKDQSSKTSTISGCKPNEDLSSETTTAGNKPNEDVSKLTSSKVQNIPDQFEKPSEACSKPYDAAMDLLTRAMRDAQVDENVDSERPPQAHTSESSHSSGKTSAGKEVEKSVAELLEVEKLAQIERFSRTTARGAMGDALSIAALNMVEELVADPVVAVDVVSVVDNVASTDTEPMIAREVRESDAGVDDGTTQSSKQTDSAADNDGAADKQLKAVNDGQSAILGGRGGTAGGEETSTPSVVARKVENGDSRSKSPKKVQGEKKSDDGQQTQSQVAEGAEAVQGAEGAAAVDDGIAQSSKKTSSAADKDGAADKQMQAVKGGQSAILGGRGGTAGGEKTSAPSGVARKVETVDSRSKFPKKVQGAKKSDDGQQTRSQGTEGAEAVQGAEGAAAVDDGIAQSSKKTDSAADNDGAADKQMQAVKVGQSAILGGRGGTAGGEETSTPSGVARKVENVDSRSKFPKKVQGAKKSDDGQQTRSEGAEGAAAVQGAEGAAAVEGSEGAAAVEGAEGKTLTNLGDLQCQLVVVGAAGVGSNVPFACSLHTNSRPHHCPAKLYCLEVLKLRSHLASCWSLFCSEKNCWDVTQVLTHWLHCVEKKCVVCPPLGDKDAEEARDKAKWVSECVDRNVLRQNIMDEQKTLYVLNNILTGEGQYVLLGYFVEYFYEVFMAFNKLRQERGLTSYEEILYEVPDEFLETVRHTCNCSLLSDCRDDRCRRLRAVLAHWTKFNGFCYATNCRLCDRVSKRFKNDRAEITELVALISSKGSPKNVRILEQQLAQMVKKPVDMQQNKVPINFKWSDENRLNLKLACVNASLFAAATYSDWTAKAVENFDLTSLFQQRSSDQLLALSRHLLYKAISAREEKIFEGSVSMQSYYKDANKEVIRFIGSVHAFVTNELILQDDVWETGNTVPCTSEQGLLRRYSTLLGVRMKNMLPTFASVY